MPIIAQMILVWHYLHKQLVFNNHLALNIKYFKLVQAMEFSTSQVTLGILRDYHFWLVWVSQMVSNRLIEMDLDCMVEIIQDNALLNQQQQLL